MTFFVEGEIPWPFKWLQRWPPTVESSWVTDGITWYSWPRWGVPVWIAYYFRSGHHKCPSKPIPFFLEGWNSTTYKYLSDQNQKWMAENTSFLLANGPIGLQLIWKNQRVNKIRWFKGDATNHLIFQHLFWFSHPSFSKKNIHYFLARSFPTPFLGSNSFSFASPACFPGRREAYDTSVQGYARCHGDTWSMANVWRKILDSTSQRWPQQKISTNGRGFRKLIFFASLFFTLENWGRF